MHISKIENNQRTQQGRLPMVYLNHYITDLSELRRITGGDWRETSSITPEYDKATHRLTETLVEGMLATEAIPAEEVEATRAATRKEAIHQISQAAKDAVENEANAALQIQMERNYKSATPHQMIVDIINWGKAIYMQAEVNKSMVAAGLADDGDYAPLCDFSSFGPKPYTVYQLYLAGLVEL